jgi:predicted permease
VPTRLYLIWGVAALLLLLAAANMANLQLARAGARRMELSIRASLGASRARLARQLITESLMLSLMGGTAGLLLAVWAGPLVETFIPDTTPMWRLHQAGVNWRVMAFMTAIAVVAGLAFGVVPALRSSKADQPTMVPSGRATETTGAVRTRAALMVMQLAVSMVLLAGAGLMLTTLSRVWAIPKGYDTDGLLTFFVRLPRALPWVTDHGLEHSGGPLTATTLRWAATPRLPAVRRQLVERLMMVPGVEAATVATAVPNVKSMGGPFSFPGRPEPTDQQRGRMWAIGVEAVPGYFDVMGMRLFAGRALTPEDQEAGRLVAVIERRTARAFWPHERQAIGDRIEYDGLTYEIVGIANDVRFWMWSDNPGNVIYMPFRTDTTPLPFFRLGNTLIQSVVVRVASDDAAVVAAIRHAVADVTGGLPIENVRSMRKAMIDASGNTPGITLLTTASALVALLLAAVGTFGIVSYTVAQRTREIGIRVALGATRRSIVRLVASSTMRLALAGAGAGALLSLWLLRFLSGELFPGLSPSDPVVLAGVGSLLVAIAVVAACLPARRAADVDPSAALRVD